MVFHKPTKTGGDLLHDPNATRVSPFCGVWLYGRAPFGTRAPLVDLRSSLQPIHRFLTTIFGSGCIELLGAECTGTKCTGTKCIGTKCTGTKCTTGTNCTGTKCTGTMCTGINCTGTKLVDLSRPLMPIHRFTGNNFWQGIH